VRSLTLAFLTGPSTYRLAATSTVLGASSSFHTSAPLAQSRKKITARRKKQKVLALRDLRAREDVREQMDPVLGDFKKEAIAAAVAAEARTARQGGAFASAGQADPALLENATGGTKWDRSLLKKVVLDRNDIWYSQPPQYDQNATTVTDAPADNAFPLPNRPSLFSNHLTSETDLDFLFKHLPEAGLARATYLAESATSPDELSRRAAEETPAQVQASEQLMRILDLRNAASRGIRTVNVRRIVEVFGGPVDASASDSSASPSTPSPSSSSNTPPQVERLDTGSSQVQAAILTHRIRLLADHIAANPRDVHNRKNLRALVHQRAKILRYYKKRVSRSNGEGLGVYEELLDKIGVDRRAVEGEITVR
jgi:small subunit ribosomal protein S15